MDVVNKVDFGIVILKIKDRDCQVNTYTYLTQDHLIPNPEKYLPSTTKLTRHTLWRMKRVPRHNDALRRLSLHMRRSNQHRNEFQMLSQERSVSILAAKFTSPTLEATYGPICRHLRSTPVLFYEPRSIVAETTHPQARLNLETSVGCSQFDRDSTGPQMPSICGLGAPYPEYAAPMKSDSTGVSLQGSLPLKLYITIQTVLPFTIVGFLNKCYLPELTEKQKQKKKKKRQH